MNEGETRTTEEICVRRECEKCGKPATWQLTYLHKNARANPASHGYGRDDVSWCSDKDVFVCDEHEKERRNIGEELGMDWCSAFPYGERFKHLFLYWKKKGGEE